MAEGSGEAVLNASIASTGSVKLAVAVRLSESVTVTEKVALAALGGVPDKNPPAVSDNQDGREEAVQVYGVEPPEAENCCEYAVPTTALASGDVVPMVSAKLTGG